LKTRRPNGERLPGLPFAVYAFAGRQHPPLFYGFQKFRLA